MAIEYFHIRESDADMVDQLVELEQEVHGNRGSGLNRFEVGSYVRFGRVYAAAEYDELLACCYFIKDFENPSKVFLYGITVCLAEAGNNIGVGLIKSAMLDLKNSGIRMVEAIVHSANYKALRIYREQLDFHVINVGDDELYEEEEFLVLRKTL